jgi:predicted SAM-dependent methyltransferase
VLPYKPAEYIGVDIQEGECVDQVCDICDLVETFGECSFDRVFCLETLEHVEDWKTGVHNLKHVLSVGGFLFVSAPDIGFHYHRYPEDYWRFQRLDYRRILSDMEIKTIIKLKHGNVIKAYRPDILDEVELKDYELYSVSNVD